MINHLIDIAKLIIGILIGSYLGTKLAKREIMKEIGQNEILKRFNKILDKVEELL